MRRLLSAQRLRAPLAIAARLRRKLLGRGDVELVVEDRVARRVFIDVGRAVPDPLARDEDRQFTMILDLAHLKRRGMTMAHEIADKAAVFAQPASATPIRDAGGLYHRRIITHVVDDPNEAVVEDRDGLVEDLLKRRSNHPPRRLRFRSQRVDLCLLVAVNRHVALACSPTHSTTRPRAGTKPRPPYTSPSKPQPLRLY